MDDIIDLLQIKIERAKTALPAETVNAIATVDWKAAILGMRSRYGYTFEQLGDLELETELLLCGLLNPSDYPKELENRMKISKAAANELVNEINDLVFKKIREELIKNTERKKTFENKSVPRTNAEEEKNNTQVLKSAGIEIIKKKESLPLPEKLELTTKAHPILAQKLSGTFQIPTVKTEHSLDNITRNSGVPMKPDSENVKVSKPSIDPYREIPE